MPNHIKNRLTFLGDGEKIISVLDDLKQEEEWGTLDFNKIIPMPEELNMECNSQTDKGLAAYTDYATHAENPTPKTESQYRRLHPEIDNETWRLGKRAYQNGQKFGAPTWYEWRIKHWGTKWNSYYPDGTFQEGDKVTMGFSTAWSAPIPVLKKLSKMMPEVEIVHEWADEDIGHNCGRIHWKNGQMDETEIPEPGKESVEFAARVLGGTPKSFNLRLNADGTDYEYFEEDDFSAGPFDPHEQSGDEQGLKM